MYDGDMHFLRKLQNEILHISLLIIGAFCQLLYFRDIVSNESTSDYVQIMLVINLGLLIPFLDFGSSLLTSFDFSVNKDTKHFSSNFRNRISFRYTCKVAAFILTVSLIMILFSPFKIFFTYTTIFALSLFGVWAIIASRSLGLVRRSIIFQNIQWPISYVLLQNFYSSESSIGLVAAYIPSLLSLIILTLYFIYFVSGNSALAEPEALKVTPFNSEDDLVTSKGLYPWLFLLTIPVPVITTADRLIVDGIFAKELVASYLVYASIFSGGLSLILNLNAAKIAEKRRHFGESNLSSLTVIGFILGASYTVFTPYLFQALFPQLAAIQDISIWFGLYIFSLSVLFHVSLEIYSINDIKLKAYFYWAFLIMWLIPSYFLSPILGVLFPIQAGIFFSTALALSLKIFLKYRNQKS